MMPQSHRGAFDLAMMVENSHHFSGKLMHYRHVEVKIKNFKLQRTKKQVNKGITKKL